jgi:hypothetical protein
LLVYQGNNNDEASGSGVMPGMDEGWAEALGEVVDESDYKAPSSGDKANPKRSKRSTKGKARRRARRD